MKRLSCFSRVFSSLSSRRRPRRRTAPALTTDKPIYAAGEVVTLRGEDCSPGEPVIIVIAAEEAVRPTTLRTTADSAGAFTLTATMPDDEDAPSSGAARRQAPVRIMATASEHGSFHATASGGISKVTAQAQFSEGEAETDGARLLELEGYWHDRLTHPTGKFNPAWVRKAADDDKKIPRGTPKGKKKGHGGSAVGAMASRQVGALVPQRHRLHRARPAAGAHDRLLRLL